MTPEEVRQSFSLLRESFATLRDAIANLQASLDLMRTGLQIAASQLSQATEIITVTAIEHERAKGKDSFKMIGPKYPRYGVRVWPEVLEAMHFDVELLAQQDRTELAAPISVRVELRTVTTEDGDMHINSPHKVLGTA